MRRHVRRLVRRDVRRDERRDVDVTCVGTYAGRPKERSLGRT